MLTKIKIIGVIYRKNIEKSIININILQLYYFFLTVSDNTQNKYSAIEKYKPNAIKRFKNFIYVGHSNIIVNISF